MQRVRLIPAMACAVACALVLAAPSWAQDDLGEQKQALTDWKALHALYEEVSGAIHKWGPSGPDRGVIGDDDREAVLEQILAYQKTAQPDVESKLAAFEEAYGDSPERVRDRWTELFHLGESGYRYPAEIKEACEEANRDQPHPEQLLRNIRSELEGLATTRLATADHIVTQGRSTLSYVETLTPVEKVRALVALAEDAEVALAFDPSSQPAQELLEQADALIKAAGGTRTSSRPRPSSDPDADSSSSSGGASSEPQPAEGGGLGLIGVVVGMGCCFGILVVLGGVVFVVIQNQKKAGAAPPGSQG